MDVCAFVILLLLTFFYYKFFYDKKNQTVTIFDNYCPWNVTNIFFFFLAYIPLLEFFITTKENNVTLVDFFTSTFIPAFLISLFLYLILKSFILIENKFSKTKRVFGLIRKLALILIIILIGLGMRIFNYTLLTNEGKCLEYSYSSHGSYCEEYE